MTRAVLVTGGAKRLGAAIARVCAAAGWRVAIHYGRSRDAAEALAAELGGIAIGGDLADLAVPARLVGAAAAWAGAPLDGLVNSASQFTFDDPAHFDPALLQRLTATNLAAPLALAREFAAQPGLTEGAIVNLLDQKVANPNPDYLSYSCTKLALAGATELLAQAFAPRVRVNAVSPGLTLKSGGQSDAQFAEVASDNLLQRPVGAETVANAVAWLLDARGVTGQNLFVDNGQRFVKRAGDVMFETVERPGTAT